MKKLLVLGTALASIAVAAPSFADTTATTTPLTGVYVGVYGGYNWSDADTNVAGFNPDIDGWEGGAFVGYKLDVLMKNFNNFGIGMNGAIEAFYGVSNSEDSVGALTLEKEDEWGVSFRPGFSVIDRATAPLGIAPYAILGYRSTEFTARGAGFTGAEDYDGFDLGIGTELIASGNFGVRAEYTHTFYSSENGIKPSSDEVRIGLAYHF